MKILFLDVDGVVCTRRSHLALGKEGGIWDAWDRCACSAIARACLKDVTLVISSTWRFHPDELWQHLKDYGLDSFVHKDWATPDLSRCVRGKCRGDEIKDWLDAHPDTSSYRILDDDSDMLEEQMPYLIQTDGEDGMSSDNMKKLLNWAGALKS